MPTHPCRVVSTILRHGEYYFTTLAPRIARRHRGVGQWPCGSRICEGRAHYKPCVSGGTQGVLKGCCTSHAFPRTRVSVAAPPVNFSLHGIMQHATCNVQHATCDTQRSASSAQHTTRTKRLPAHRRGSKAIVCLFAHASAGRAVTGMHLEHTGSDGLCISRMSTC